MSLNRANLSPFAHELDRFGSKCAHDCAACRWVREMIAAQVVAESGLERRYEDCELFQKGLQVIEELGLA